MKLGFFMMPLHSLGMSYSDMYDMDIEAAVYADQLGYDELWIGEHSSAQVEPISDSLQFLSAMIGHTKSIKLCTGVLNLPHRHPATVAANAAMFDHMAKGRFIMGIGPGGLSTDFELFGTLDADRQAMMMESIDIITRLWNSEAPYDIKGKFWNVRIVENVQPDMGLGPIPTPYQKPFPNFVTSAMSPYSGTAKIAGTRGWELTSANFNAPWIVRSHWQKYAEGAQEAGHRADPSRWRVARSLLVTESDAEAADYLARESNTVKSYYNYLYTQLGRAGAIKIFLTKPDQKPEELTLQKVMDSMVIAGSTSTVLDKLVDFVDQVGPFGGLMSAFHEWDDRHVWRNSMRLVADEVMPRFRQHMESRLASAIAAQ